MKRRIPKDARLEYAEQAVRLGITRKTAKQLQKTWISRDKRRTHKRERREGKRETE